MDILIEKNERERELEKNVLMLKEEAKRLIYYLESSKSLEKENNNLKQKLNNLKQDFEKNKLELLSKQTELDQLLKINRQHLNTIDSYTEKNQKLKQTLNFLIDKYQINLKKLD